MKKRIIPFAIAGAVGFGVDAGVLLLASPLLGAFGGRAVSFACAVLTTWLINRNFAFADRAGSTAKHWEFLRYFGAMLPGAAVNWLAYSLVVMMQPPNPVTLTLAVAAGSISGMATNLAAANWLVFREKR